ncbi:MAG TPA: enoyl-CoA hydratase-related protein [Aeromicrobium sp.]|nr:enoyl-CoA hydratase-related protein [Aeromicrobium sp.]
MTDAVLIQSTDGLLRITWNQPDRLNGLSAQMLNDAAAAIENKGADVRAVLITGSGRAFSSGAALGPDFDGSATLDGANRLIRAITRADVPVVSGVNGIAAGVGVSIALAADVTVAKASGYFLLAFVNIGLLPDGGASELVAASIGRARANRLAMLGERLPAEQAADLGLIAFAVADEDYDAKLAEVVDKIATGPTIALGSMKQVITAATLPTLDSTLEAERAGQLALFETFDAEEGGRAFLEKRPARFEGR